MEYKRKLIYILISIVVFLLIVNVALGFFHFNFKNNQTASLNQKTIEKRFNSVLAEYGIEDNWVTKGKIQKGKTDSLKNSFVVNVPSDVPIAQIIKDINIEFAHQPVTINSSEEKINGLTNLIIESGKIIKLIADFKVDKSINREFSSIGFLIYGMENIDETKLNDLLKNPFHYGVVLPLEPSSQQFAQTVIDHKREYYIELTSDSDDDNFELGDDLKVDEIKKNVNKIISSFNSPKIFFIDQSSSGISKGVQEIIFKGFEDRDRKILNSNKFKNISGENKSDLKSLLKFYLNKLKPNETQIFRIDFEDWITVQNDLNTFEKKGNKIIFPSRLF